MLAWAVRTVVISSVVAGIVIFALAPDSPIARWFNAKPSASVGAATVAPSRASVPNEYVFRRSADGHYYVDAEVNGTIIHFLIDTGATFLTLSPDDARAAGLNLSDSDFSSRVNTANGVARIAPVVLREVDLKQISITNVDAAVVEAPMASSLLGMSFLSRLQGYEVHDGELVLRW